MNKKLIFSSISLALLLSACGGGGGGSSDSSKSSSSNNTTSTSLPSSVQKSVASEDTEPTLNDNSKVALSMPNVTNDSSSPLDELK